MMMIIAIAMIPVPTKTQLSNFLGTPGEDYFKGNPESLKILFQVIWWGKIHYFNIIHAFQTIHVMMTIVKPVLFAKAYVCTSMSQVPMM